MTSKITSQSPQVSLLWRDPWKTHLICVDMENWPVRKINSSGLLPCITGISFSELEMVLLYHHQE